MGRPSQETPCALCSKLVDLTVDLYADENGKAVHGRCYIDHLTKPKPAGIWRSLRLRWQQSKFGLESLRE